MRIVHVTHFFPPESRGGTQEYVARIAVRQKARGDDVRVITGSSVLDRPHDVEETTHLGVGVTRVFRERHTETFSGDLGSRRILELVTGRVRDAAAELVHLHHWHGLSHGLVGSLRDAGLPVVVSLHDLFTTCMRFFRMPDQRSFCDAGVTFADCARCVSPDLPDDTVEAIEEAARSRFDRFQGELRRASRVLCVSAAQRDLLTSLPGFDFTDIEVLRLGLPPAAPVAGRDPVADGRLRVVYWGGIDPRKGSHVLAEAAGLAAREVPVDLTMHGRVFEERYREEITGLAGAAALSLPGAYEDEQLDEFARESDVAVFPFLAFETHALAVDEALLRGLPVIVPAHGAPRERIAGRGVALPAGDARVLADLLVALGRDPARLAEMRAAAHAASSLEEHLTALDAIYARALRG